MPLGKQEIIVNSSCMYTALRDECYTLATLTVVVDWKKLSIDPAQPIINQIFIMDSSSSAVSLPIVISNNKMLAKNLFARSDIPYLQEVLLESWLQTSVYGSVIDLSSPYSLSGMSINLEPTSLFPLNTWCAEADEVVVSTRSLSI